MTGDIAIVGTGGIAEVHAESLAALSHRARIVAAVDTDPGRLTAFADRWNVARRHRDLPDLLAAGGVDLVHLCTPPAVHEEQAIVCLEHDLSVLCEKPPARSLAAFDRIAEAERASTGCFATVSQHRFGGRAGSLAALAPRLGEPMTAICHTLWYRPDEYFDVPWRGRWHTEGGGPTMGHGIHQMDLMLSIMGDWRNVVAVADRRARFTDTEDISAAIVTFESGAVATVVNSLLSPRETSYLRFDHAHATVELEHLYGYGDADWRLTPLPGDETELAAAWAETSNGVASGHTAQFTAVLDALDAGRPPPVTVTAARATMELIAAVYASAFGGGVVKRGQITAESPFYQGMAGTGAPWPPKKGPPT